jgi:hypothetical protein
MISGYSQFTAIKGRQDILQQHPEKITDTKEFMQRCWEFCQTAALLQNEAKR